MASIVTAFSTGMSRIISLRWIATYVTATTIGIDHSAIMPAAVSRARPTRRVAASGNTSATPMPTPKAVAAAVISMNHTTVRRVETTPPSSAAPTTSRRTSKRSVAQSISP